MPFECLSEELRGSFTWNDFAISARVQGHPRWRLEGQVLTLPKSRLADTFTSALADTALERLIKIPAMPRDAIIESFDITAADDLEVTLRSDILPICAGCGTGRPAGPAGTRNQAASGSDERSSSPIPMAKALP